MRVLINSSTALFGVEGAEGLRTVLSGAETILMAAQLGSAVTRRTHSRALPIYLAPDRMMDDRFIDKFAYLSSEQDVQVILQGVGGTELHVEVL